MTNPLDWPAAWGFLGAFMFAAMRVTTYLGSEETKGHLRQCCTEAFTALILGTIAAAAFEPWLSRLLKASSVADIRAMSTVIGLVAYLAYPEVLKLLNATILNRLKGGH